MRSAVGIMAALLVLQGCVTAPSGTGRGSHTCVTTITGPDGTPQQAVVEADDASAAAMLCEGDMASDADIARAMLGDGPVSKADKVVVRTKSAPAARPAPAPIVAAPQPTHPAPLQTPQPQTRPAAHGPACSLRMVGGTGYVCATH